MVVSRKMVRSKKSIRKYAKGKWAVGPTLQQRMRGPEVKIVDVATALATISTTGTVVLLNSLATGTELYQRVGRSVSMKSLEFKAFLYPSGNVATNDAIRVALVYDRQPDGVAPSWSEVFTAIAASGAVTTDSFVGPNATNIDRFKILYEWHLPIIPSTSVTPSALAQQDANLPTCMHKVISLGGLEARYGNAATHPTTGGLYMLALGNVAAGAAGCNINYQSRLKYTDM